MSKSVLQIKNLTQAIDAFRKAPKLAAEKIEEAGIKVVAVLSTYSKQNHRYTRRFGNLEKDTDGRVDGNVVTFGLGFYPSATRITYRDGTKASYGNAIHEGFGTWKADPFIEDGVKKNTKKITKIYQDKIDELIEEI